jgi:hypothetical protein
MLHSRRDGAREHGQIVILFALALVVILVFASIVVDLGVLRNNRQILVNTLDAAALAGGTKLPVNGSTEGTAANTLIASTIQANYPGLPTSAYTISYRCLIGVDGTGQPDLAEITAGVCNPTHALGHAPVAGDFVAAGADRLATCAPSLGDKCNVVVITGSAITQYGLGGVVGITSGSTGAVQSASCNGPCGPVAIPVDLVVITDRTASMNATDITNVQVGANAVLSVYNPALQRIALGTIGPSQVNASGLPITANCPNSSSSAYPTAVYGVGNANRSDVDYFGPAPTDIGRWIPLGFSGTDSGTPPVTWNQSYSTGPYSPTGTVNPSSNLAKAISCVVSWTYGTNLDTPIRMAGYYLQTYGRPGVKKGIILETDGTPQAGNGSAHYTCDQANAAATAVKALPENIVIYTIGYGTNDSYCPNRHSTSNCPNDPGGTQNCNPNETANWSLDPASTLLSSMASDPSKFYNAPASSAVAAAFTSAAQDLAKGGLHLVQASLTPKVTAVSPNHGPLGGTTVVTISGQFLTGAWAVKFGTTSATTFTVNSDTSITATAPAGAAGTVDITVSTPGGTSAIVAADHYTYP